MLFGGSVIWTGEMIFYKFFLQLYQLNDIVLIESEVCECDFISWLSENGGSTAVWFRL